MKPLRYLFFAALLVLGTAACDTTDFEEPFDIDANDRPAYVEVDTDDATVGRGVQTSLTVALPVTIARDVEIDYSLSGSAVEGSDYRVIQDGQPVTVDGQGSFVIAYNPDENAIDENSVIIRTLENADVDAPRTLTMTLTGARAVGTGDSLAVGRIAEERSVTLTILPSFADIAVRFSPEVAFAAIEPGATAVDTLVMRNAGAARATEITDLALGGGDAAAFEFLTDENAFIIEAGDSVMVPVQFMPEAPGDYSALITFTASNLIYDADPEEALTDLAVAVTGHATSASIAIMPDSIGFGAVAVGGSRIRSLMIANEGDRETMLEAMTITGADAASFELLDNPGSMMLAPSDSVELFIRFAPMQAQDGYTAALSFEGSNDPEAADFMVPLTGSNPDDGAED